MIKHLHNESAALFKGTKYEHSWYYYHDALSLKTAKQTVEWMKAKGIYKHWLLPLEINKGTVYENRPVGNSPEMMPLDSSLNKDHDDVVRFHMALTAHLSEEDPRKFSLSTPKRGASAYLCAWEGAPSSRHIIEDTNKFLYAIKVISDFEGIVVPGLGNQKGHQAEGLSLKKRSGIWIKNTGGQKDRWMHEDAHSCINKQIAMSPSGSWQYKHKTTDK